MDTVSLLNRFRLLFDAMSMALRDCRTSAWKSAIPVIIGLLMWEAQVSAQQAARLSRVARFARFVPASTKLLITIHNPREVDEALRRAHAWRLSPLVSSAGGDSPDTFDLRAALQDFLGPGSSIDVDDVMRSQIAIVAHSWSELGSAVWLVRLRDEDVLDRWFPGHRRGDSATAPKVRFFLMQGGVYVCVREGILAMGRRKQEGSPLQGVLRVMTGRETKTLAGLSEFRALVAALPANPLAVAYTVSASEDGDGSSGSSTFLPALEQVALGLYEGGGRIDVALRGTPVGELHQTALLPEAVTRFEHLPRTTLLAWATRIPPRRASSDSSPAFAAGNLGRLQMILEALRDPSLRSAGPLPKLGPHAIIVWGQDLSGKKARPQFAVLVECEDAGALSEEVSYIVGNALQLLGAVDAEDLAKGTHIQEQIHLGTRIHYIPRSTHPGGSEQPLRRVLGSPELSWAVSGRWLILGLSRDHVQRILDARLGLAPRLGELRDLSSLQRRRVDRAMFSVAQAGLAADVLEEWLADLEAGAASLLDPMWWDPSNRSGKTLRRTIGIELEKEMLPGVSVVSRVYPGVSAEGRLQTGDRIIGVDGFLLNLESPNVDLRRRVADKGKSGELTLRVQREDRNIDVALTVTVDNEGGGRPLIDPADAVRELASIGKTIRLASFTVFATENEQYAARLSLRFAPFRSP